MPLHKEGHGMVALIFNEYNQHQTKDIQDINLRNLFLNGFPYKRSD